MAKLDFAFWDAVPHAAAGAGIADEYDAHIRLAQRVEALGWHSYFVIEHQNTPQGCSSPSVYLTAVARATSTLRLGAMMWQLPFYHPLRLAQEVAMLDQLSRGRVELGTGIGVHEHEFIRWGVDYYQRAAISEEVLAIVKMAWAQQLPRGQESGYGRRRAGQVRAVPPGVARERPRWGHAAHFSDAVGARRADR
jgi:alkanesulfonate monooxygenase SsuD/methylene tetrahydromethanopterin reductase-like flavin-dependent oxidoreductase (luciferase family)